MSLISVNYPGLTKSSTATISSTGSELDDFSSNFSSYFCVERTGLFVISA